MSEILVNTIKKADGTGSLTVPADTGTVLTSATALSNFPSGFANGITMADQWRLTTDVTATSGDITANLERVDTDGFGQIGTGMTESTGVFTFPSTGVYLIEANGRFYNSSSDVRFVGVSILTTTDGSNFDKASDPLTNIGVIASNDTIANSFGSFIFDVTSTSTHKVKFKLENSTSCVMQGGTSVNQTHFTFIRLGDT